MKFGSDLLLQSCLVVMFGYLLSDFYSSTSSTHLNINIKNKDILHAISAAVGSALSITLLYPLETIRTRLQVDESLTPHSSFLLIFHIGRGEGFAGLYKGWYSLVVALMSLNFVYFYCFHVLRRWLAVHLESLNQVMFDLVVGYLAGCFAVLVTGPLWLGEECILFDGYVFVYLCVLKLDIVVYHISYSTSSSTIPSPVSPSSSKGSRDRRMVLKRIPQGNAPPLLRPTGCRTLSIL